MIHRMRYNGRNIEMKKGIYKIVIETTRGLHEYDFSQLTPSFDDGSTETTMIWKDTETAFTLSCKDSQFSQSEVVAISKFIEDVEKNVESILNDAGRQVSEKLTELYDKASHPYKPEVNFIKIGGFVNGKLVGKIALDRALPVREADLKKSFTMPFVEDEAETQQEYIDPETEVEYQ